MTTERMYALIESIGDSLDRIADSLEATTAMVEKLANPVYEVELAPPITLVDGSPIVTEVHE